MNLIKDFTPSGETKTAIANAFQIGMTQVPEEISALYEYIIRTKGTLGNIMEIGTKMGGTFDLWCRLAKGLKVSIDLPGGIHGGWMMKDHPYLKDSYKKRDKYFRKKYKHAYMVTGDSHSDEVFMVVDNLFHEQKWAPLELLFLDGDHTYEGIKDDFESYQHLVKNGGLIIFHDINDTPHHREINVGVNQFWEELSDEEFGTKLQFNSNKHWAGIGVLKLNG